MTPLDKTLVDQMKSALSKSAPEVAKNLDKLTSKTYLGDHVYAKQCFGTITLTVEHDTLGPFQVIELKPETFQALEQFAVKIGWRCS